MSIEPEIKVEVMPIPLYATNQQESFFKSNGPFKIESTSVIAQETFDTPFTFDVVPESF